MSRKTAAVAVIVAVLALAGCGGPPAPDTHSANDPRFSGSDYAEFPVKLSDGRSVVCLKSLSGYDSFSCDWEHAK